MYEIMFDPNDYANELAQKLSSISWSRSAMPNTASSVFSAAQYVRNVWGDYLAGETQLDGIGVVKKPNGKLAQSLKTVSQGDFVSKVYSDNPKISEIQNGTNPVYFDMKQTHPYGRKSRVNKDGIPYLIIPFRWGTPNGKGTARSHFNNFIPQKNYESNVKALDLMHTTGIRHIEVNAQGKPIDRDEYANSKGLHKWDRLSKEEAWDDRSIGLVRMKDMANGKSTYFTFRVISAKSPFGTWLYWKDGTDAVDMMGALVRTTKDGVIQIIKQGIVADLLKT